MVSEFHTAFDQSPRNINKPGTFHIAQSMKLLLSPIRQVLGKNPMYFALVTGG
jgi:hypothetical protein